MNNEIIRVQFQAEGVYGDLNCQLTNPETLGPMARVPGRALDYAVLHANELRDVRPLNDLQEFRRMRADQIRRHFRNCADMMIEKIEDTETWDKWLDRLK